MYNSDITSIEEAKTNFSEVFPEIKGSYSQHFEHKDEIKNLPFESYMAKEPLRIDSNGRKIILNGNRLSFLEPMESTAIALYLNVAEFTFDWIIDGHKDEFRMKDVTSNINKRIHEIHKFISWHYIRGSIYDTPFWRAARAETTAIFEQPDDYFENIVNSVKSTDYIDLKVDPFYYGPWPAWSIKMWEERL